MIARSRNPSVDYSATFTQRVTLDGTTSTETSAEYHRGPLHRVETPRARVIANCGTGDRIVYYPLEDRFERTLGDDGGACGIGNPETVLSGRMLPGVTGPWGRAYVVELAGPDFVRRYVVTEDGILVSSDYRPRRAEVGFAIEALRVEVTRGTPDAAMFEEASLRHAYARPPSEDAPTPP